MVQVLKSNILWEKKVDIAVCDTMSVLNSGAADKAVILKRIGMDPGYNVVLFKEAR